MKIGRYNYADQFGADGLDGLLHDIRLMLLEGRYVLGPDVAAFEEQFGKFVGVPHVCGVNSGTDALIIGLICMGVEAGDEVITQANTFNATVAAIRLVGAVPVLVDADDASWLMSVRGAADAITNRTRVLLPVHLYGKPTPMAPLLDLAARHGLAIAEDAAQAVGARRDGVHAGTVGSIGCFSFHPSKNLAAAGDAGAVVTSSPELARAIRLRRELGQAKQNEHVVVGFNSKLDALQARILSFKLPHVERWSLARRAIAEHYRARLHDLPLTFQRSDPDETHAYHLFVVRTMNRDGLLTHLRNRGVDAVIRYPVPIHLQSAFADLGWRKGQYPVAERLAAESLCLPIRPDMREAETEYVIEQVRGFFRA